MSRSIGINSCNGEYIILIDADDYISNGFLYDLYNCAIYK